MQAVDTSGASPSAVVVIPTSKLFLRAAKSVLFTYFCSRGRTATGTVPTHHYIPRAYNFVLSKNL